LVGAGRAKEMILTGRMVDAQEALRIGLVDQVVPKEGLLEEARKMAMRILPHGPLAIQAAKKAINSGLNLPLCEGLKWEAKYFGYLCGTEDKNEGATAFFQKRKASFKGK
jgi:enoyl-CoA hydratase